MKFPPPTGFKTSVVGVIFYSPLFPQGLSSLKMINGLNDIPLNFWEECEVLLVQKSHLLAEHANQWAFPGGKPNREESLVECLLREIYEEVGINLNNDHLFSSPLIPSFTGTSMYWIYPYWGVVDQKTREIYLKPDLQEVSHAVWVPWEVLQKNKKPSVKIPDFSSITLKFSLAESYIAQMTKIFTEDKFYEYQLPDHKPPIWGATANIITSIEKLVFHHT